MKTWNHALVTSSCIAIALVTTGCRPSDPKFMSPLGVGATAPDISAAGWVNGTPLDTKGKIVVLDCWAYW